MNLFEQVFRDHSKVNTSLDHTKITKDVVFGVIEALTLSGKIPTEITDTMKSNAEQDYIEFKQRLIRNSN